MPKTPLSPDRKGDGQQAGIPERHQALQSESPIQPTHLECVRALSLMKTLTASLGITTAFRRNTLDPRMTQQNFDGSIPFHVKVAQLFNFFGPPFVAFDHDEGVTSGREFGRQIWPTRPKPQMIECLLKDSRKHPHALRSPKISPAKSPSNLPAFWNAPRTYPHLSPRFPAQAPLF